MMTMLSMLSRPPLARCGDAAADSSRARRASDAEKRFRTSAADGSPTAATATRACRGDDNAVVYACYLRRVQTTRMMKQNRMMQTQTRTRMLETCCCEKALHLKMPRGGDRREQLARREPSRIRECASPTAETQCIKEKMATKAAWLRCEITLNSQLGMKVS
jgi:hypothetical protein